jgi:hypothetical protein
MVIGMSGKGHSFGSIPYLNKCIRNDMFVFRAARKIFLAQQPAFTEMWRSATDLEKMRIVDEAYEAAVNTLRLAFYESTKEYNRFSDCMALRDVDLLAECPDPAS